MGLSLWWNISMSLQINFVFVFLDRMLWSNLVNRILGAAFWAICMVGKSRAQNQGAYTRVDHAIKIKKQKQFFSRMSPINMSDNQSLE